MVILYIKKLNILKYGKGIADVISFYEYNLLRLTMKTKIIVGSVLAALSGAAFAQSSVTIYGVIDAGLTASKGVTASDGSKKSRVGLDSSILSGSRLGFRGVEDLGGGTSAIFNIENGFNVDNGTQGQGALFGRRAIVGLTNNNVGTLELGRQSSVLDNTLGSFDATGNTSALGAANVIKYDNRLNNSVTYTTPTYAGFNAKANYGFGEKTGSASDGRFYGLALNYANGAFAATLAGGHSDYKNSTASIANNSISYTSSNSVADAASFFNTYNSSTQTGTVANKRDLYLLGASYDFNVVKTYALLSYGKTGVNNFQNASTTNVASTGNYKDKAAVLGVSVPLGASTFYASAGYVNLKADGAKSGNAQQYALGYSYAFSKRTDLYVAYDYIKNSDELKAKKQVYTTFNSGNQLLAVGVRHRF